MTFHKGTDGLSQAQKSQLARAVDSIPEFRGAELGIFTNGEYECLRESNHASGLRTMLVLEPVAQKTAAASATSGSSAPITQSVSRRFGPELLGATVNCLGTVLSGAAVGAEVLSTPVTAGSSAGLLFITVPTLSASALQCGLSLGRVSNSLFAPENNQDLDSSGWFSKTSTVLDAISLLDAVRGAGEVSRLAIQLRKSSNRPFVEILKSMSRTERKQLAEEIGRYTTEAATRKQFLSMVRSGKLARVLTQQKVDALLREKLLTTVSGALAIGGSALPRHVSTTSGLINEYVVHVLQEK